jgi:hypothetical protein
MILGIEHRFPATDEGQEGFAFVMLEALLID